MESENTHSTLIIRADATARIGIGHVMRCLSLGESWAGEKKNFFLGQVENKTLVNRIKGNGFQFKSIPAVYPNPDDLSQTIGHLMRQRESLNDAQKQVVILDGYQFDTHYQKALRDSDRFTLVVDDMIHLSRYDADIILNQSCIPHGKYYQCNSNALILTGPKFRLIRNEFRNSASVFGGDNTSETNLLVFFGGADKRNATLKVIRALQRLEKKHLQIKILLGPVNRNKDRLKEELSNFPNGIEFVETVSDMASLFNWADIGVAAGGETSWEMAYMGLPLFLMALNDNQVSNVKALCDAGAAVSAGRLEDFSENNFLSLLDELCSASEQRANMSHKARQLVDGEGPNRIFRIVTAMNSRTVRSESLSLRPVSTQDAHALYQLAMNPDVRQNSFSPNPISYTHHLRWFHEKLNRKEDTVIWVLDLEGVVVGQIRYDRHSAGHAEIDFSVHPAFRGLGFGSRLLDKTRSMAVKRLRVNRLKGVVFDSNQISRSCFIKSGYTAKIRSQIHARTCEVFEYRQG